MSTIRPIPNDDETPSSTSTEVDVRETVPPPPPGFGDSFDDVELVDDIDEEDPEDVTPEQEAATVEAFLGAVQRESATATVAVASLGGKTVTVRELSERELDDINLRFADADAPRGRSRARSPRRASSVSSIPAHIVATAMIEPDLTDPKVFGALREQYNVRTVADLLPKVIRPLELAALAEIVLDLSGAGEDAVQVVKN